MIDCIRKTNRDIVSWFRLTPLYEYGNIIRDMLLIFLVPFVSFAVTCKIIVNTVSSNDSIALGIVYGVLEAIVGASIIGYYMVLSTHCMTKKD